MLAFLVLVALAARAWWSAGVVFQVGATRDLLLDARRVELGEGFGGRTDLITWHDVAGVNPDRPGVAVMMPRAGTLVWHVDAPGGRFVTQVARRQQGPQADDTPCTVRFSVPGAAGVSVEVAVPACPAREDAGPEQLREGPFGQVALQLPDPSAAIRIQTLSPADVPAASTVMLLSPRVICEPEPVDAGDARLAFRRSERLLPKLPPSESRFVFGERRTQDGAPQEVTLPGAEATGSFTGLGARPALAFLAGAEVELTVDLQADTVLSAALALDDRMPPGSWADVRLTVDGDTVASELVDSPSWRELEVPLGRHAGTNRRLGLRISTSRLEPAWVDKLEPDFALGENVAVSYRATRLRVGLGEPRLERPVQVARRVATPERPSVLLIQVETLRADLLHLFGSGPADLTPHLDRLAGEGRVWRSAFAPSPWTVPSTATLLTGLHPSAHGAVNHLRTVLPGDVPTLAERAQAAGVPSGAVVASDVLPPRAGFARGFGAYAHVPYANARQVNDLALAWLSDHVGQQFLLFLHYFDPHHPFNAPGSFRERYVEEELRGSDVEAAHQHMVQRLLDGEVVGPDHPDMRLLRQRYLGEIAWLDSQLGELLKGLEALGLARTTAVVFTADHGEEFMEHGLYGHGSQLYDESLWVPLIVRVPEGSPASVDAVTGTAGLCASVLRLLDVPFDVESMVPALDAGHGWSFSETHKGLALDGKGDPLRRFETTVRTADARLVWRWPVEGEPDPGTGERFDLLADPRCLSPLTPGDEAGRRLLNLMHQSLSWSHDHRGAALGEGGDAEWLGKLQELGYVGGGR